MLSLKKNDFSKKKSRFSKGGPFDVRTSEHLFLYFLSMSFLFKKQPLWCLLKRYKSKNFGDSVKMPGWICSSRPDKAPLSRNRVHTRLLRGGDRMSRERHAFVIFENFKVKSRPYGSIKAY